MNDTINRRLLIIDDNPAIHDDFRKILGRRAAGDDGMAAAEAALFGDAADVPTLAGFEIDSAFQGAEGLARVQQAVAAGRPYALVFVDVRMPPGWDGVETTERIWKEDPDLQIVICTAYSDYSWDELVSKLGQSDQLVILKKPFDNIEVSQLAEAMTHKWRLTQQIRQKMDDLEKRVQERTVELTSTNESLRTEIIERKQAEQALNESREHYRNLIESQSEGVVITDADRCFTFANPAAETILGVWPGQLVGKKLDDYVDEKGQSIIDEQLKLRMAGQRSSYEIDILTSAGATRQILITSSPRLNPAGLFCGSFMVFTDITQRKLAERALRESQRLLKAILDNIPDPAWLKDAQGRYLVGNKSLAEVCKCRLEEIVGKTDLKGFTKPAAAPVQPGNQAAISSIVVRREDFIPDAEGHDRWFDTIETPVLNEHGEIVGAAGIARDITEHRKSEAALRESEERYHSLFENMSEGFAFCRIIFEQDRAQDFEYLDVNKAFETLTGLKQVVGKKVTEVIPGIRESNPELFEVFGRVVATGKSEKFEIHVKPLGRWFSVAAYSQQKGHFVAMFDNITDRKVLDEQMERLRSEYAVVLNSLGEGVHWIDIEGRIKFENPAAAKMLGYEVDELIGKSAHVTMHHTRADGTPFPQAECGIYATLQDGKARRVTDEVFWRKDGTSFPVEYLCTPAYEKDGRSGGSVVVFTDVTERQRAEELLRVRTSALQAAANGILITDRKGHILSVNAAFTQLTGYSAEETAGKTPALLKSGAQDQSFYETMWQTILAGNVWHGELVNRRKDGTVYHEEMSITPVRDEAGNIQNFVAIKQDISARIQFAKDLARERDLLQALMDNLPDHIYFKDASSCFTRINLAQAKHLGLQRPEEAVGKSDADFFPMHQARQKLVDEQCLLATGSPVLGLVEKSDTINGTRWVSSTKVPLHDASGKTTGLVGVSRDITQQKQYEEELRAQQESFRALTDNAPDAIARIDRDLRFVYVNQVLGKIFDRPAEQFLGRTNHELNLPAQEQWNGATRRVFETGQIITFEFQTEFPAGIRHFEVRLVPERSQAGKVQFVLGLTRDITEERKIEKERQMMELQMRQSQKLESIGQLAAGIAHEINTPTQYVGDNTRFLKDAFGSIIGMMQDYGSLLAAAKAGTIPPEQVANIEAALVSRDIEYLFAQIPAAIQETLEGVDRVSKIVRAMKEFSHPGGKEKSAADLNKAIEGTTVVARNEWKYVADLKLDLDPELPLVPCFLGEFNQVVLNLIVNAAHAIGDVVKKNPGTMGVITIQTRRDGDHVAMRVSDTGTGIAEANRGKIFEPFFTTKDVGKGTGQGLALIYNSIVKKHGGTASFETEMGKGTTFIIRLPITPPNPAGEKSPVTPAEIASTP